jgi:hypothetical protein
MLREVKQHRIGGKGREGKWRGIKHNACTGITTRQKSCWPINRYLNIEGQEWKTSHAKDILMGARRVKEGS